MGNNEPPCRNELITSWKGCKTKTAQALVQWFKKELRPFPWRIDYHPYEIWISEVMLQQTQAARGWEYYERWMKRFPDIHTLAAASETEVLSLWQGLGYYSRARFILKTARIVQKDYNGVLPRDRKKLLSLPGIGPYTANAILSIAFNEPCCVMDGNVLRICARLLDIPIAIDSAPLQKTLEKFLENMLQHATPRLFNQALMELGALVCTPRSPSCLNCPLRQDCLSYQRGTVLQRPVKKQVPPVTRIYSITGIVVHENKIFLHKISARGLFANLWGFPAVENTSDALNSSLLEKMFRRQYNMTIKAGRKLTSFVHSYTRYRVSLDAYLCNLTGKAAPEDENTRWLTLEQIQKIPMPSAQNRIYEVLLKQRKE